MAMELLKRVQSSTTFNAPTVAGELPQHLYPTKPHPKLANSTIETDLTDMHEFLATDVDSLGLGEKATIEWAKER